jgi:hypothetical protein
MQQECRCLVCGKSSPFLFEKEFLFRYAVAVYGCENCGFVFTETPYWLEEAYADAISALDVGMVSRNLYLVEETQRIIGAGFDAKAQFLDYAGGYGLFVRMMRDKGFNFYRYDRYCRNIFAQNFDLKDLAAQPTFALVTAFEVLEHLVDPVAEVRDMLRYADSLLFSTLLVPAHIQDQPDWWYFAPETGQHIGFFSLRALEILAEQVGCHLYSNRTDLHLLTRRAIADPFVETPKSWHVRLAEKYLRWARSSAVAQPGLLPSDYALARQRIAEDARPPH